VRVDLDLLARAVARGMSTNDVETAVAVLRVFWRSGEAEAEAERLNAAQHGKGVWYFPKGLHAAIPSDVDVEKARTLAARAGGSRSASDA
jgi:hypothetical protein